MWSKKSKDQALTFRLPRLYRPIEKLSSNSPMLRLIPFADEQSTRPQFEMRLDRTLLEMGPIARLNIPRLVDIQHKSSKIMSGYNHLSETYPCKDSENVAENFAKLGVSYDQNAEKLTNLYLPGELLLILLDELQSRGIFSG